MNLCIVDLETTGLDPVKHEIIEIGAVLLADNKEIGTFECKVHPLHISAAEPRALEVNGYKREDWEEAFLLPNALKLLNQFISEKCGLDHVYFMSYGVAFDWGFMQQAYSSTDIKSPFQYHHLDLLTLCWHEFPDAQSLSLKNVCATLGIDPEPEIHRALNGARSAVSVYEKLVTNPEQ